VKQEQSIGEYRKLIKEKTNLLEIYRDATLKIVKQMRQKNLSGANTGINKRQQMITRINKIDSTLKEITPQIPEPEQITYNEMNKDLADFYQHMKQIIGDIFEVEKDCMEIVKAEQNKLRREILYYRQHKNQSKGYLAGGAAVPKFIDTRIR
jgi:hypothetical protein